MDDNAIAQISIISRGEGIYVFDERGQKLIDCASGTFNLSLGYSHPEILEAINRQAANLIHGSSTHRSQATDELVERLSHISPWSLTAVNINVTGGSMANEGAVKAAQYATGHRDVITLFRGHHGNSIAMNEVSGKSSRRAPFYSGSISHIRVPDPYCFRCFYQKTPDICGMLCAKRIEEFASFASSGDVACVLVEPVLGAGGNIVPPKEYFRELRRVCDRIGALLIFDEVQTGIGRLGYMLASEYFDVSPDITTLGKGLGGSGAQVAAIIGDATKAEMPVDHHSFTFGGNVMAAAAANKTLEIIERPEFLANVRNVGRNLYEGLWDLKRQFWRIADVRGLGMMLGIEIVSRDGYPDCHAAEALVSLGKTQGLVLRNSEGGKGNVLKVRPPLITTMNEAGEILGRLKATFLRYDALGRP